MKVLEIVSQNFDFWPIVQRLGIVMTDEDDVPQPIVENRQNINSYSR